AAYEAAGTVAGVVEATRRIVPDVVVVDDGSSDGTCDAAARAGARVLRLPSHQGKGAALKSGFGHALKAGGDAVVTLDADGRHEPRRMLECWRRTGAALVIGSRAHLEEERTRVRRFGNGFSPRALSYFSGVSIADAQSGFRLYDAALLRALPLRGRRYELESEV